MTLLPNPHTRYTLKTLHTIYIYIYMDIYPEYNNFLWLMIQEAISGSAAELPPRCAITAQHAGELYCAQAKVSYSLNSFRGGSIGDYIGEYDRV